MTEMEQFVESRDDAALTGIAPTDRAHRAAQRVSHRGDDHLAQEAGVVEPRDGREVTRPRRA